MISAPRTAEHPYQDGNKDRRSMAKMLLLFGEFTLIRIPALAVGPKASPAQGRKRPFAGSGRTRYYGNYEDLFIFIRC